jgi:hypothetical protein
MRNGEEREGRELDGVTMRGNRGGAGSSTRWGKNGAKGGGLVLIGVGAVTGAAT